MIKHLNATAAIALTLLVLAATSTHAQLQSHDLVAICGDSITEQKQYSVFMQTYLLACAPQPNLRAMQFGWGGEVSWGFTRRMENDVLRFEPTVATTCYGMNDGGYAPLTAERAERYRDAMSEIVKTFKDAGVRLVVVGSPGAVDSDTFRKDPDAAAIYNQTLSQLRDIAREVAAEQGVAFADVHAAMMDAMTRAKEKYGPAYHLGGADGVHPAANGHLVMAYAFLKALGCDGRIGTITMDLSGGRTTATEGHEVIESSRGVAELQSERYPFCFFGDATSPESTRSIVELTPFNQDLNRVVLVVNNAPPDAKRFKVSWGEANREFSAEELAKGVNLAAAFLDENPFREAFARVEQAVRAQQNFETPMIKQFVHAVPAFKQMVPAEAETLDRIAQAMFERHRELQDAAGASVRPVRHTIRVEALK